MSGKNNAWYSRAAKQRTTASPTAAAAFSPMNKRTRKKVTGPRRKHKDYMTKDEYIDLVNAYQDCKNVRRKKIIAQRVIVGLEHLNIKICRGIVQKWPGSDLEDTVQAGRFGIFRALQAWDRNKSECKGSGFLTYVYYWIFSEARRMMMQEHRGIISLPQNNIPAEREHELPTGWVAYDESIGDADDGMSAGDFTCYHNGIYGSLEARGQGSDEVGEVLRKISKKVLTRTEHDVVWRHMDGETLQSISKTYGRTRERIRQINNKALGKMRQALTDSHPEMVPNALPSA